MLSIKVSYTRKSTPITLSTDTKAEVNTCRGILALITLEDLPKDNPFSLQDLARLMKSVNPVTPFTVTVTSDRKDKDGKAEAPKIYRITSPYDVLEAVELAWQAKLPYEAARKTFFEYRDNLASMLVDSPAQKSTTPAQDTQAETEEIDPAYEAWLKEREAKKAQTSKAK